MRHFAALLVFAVASVANAGATAEFFARAAFTGMQLSIADAEAQGKVPSSLASCMRSHEYARFLPVFEAQLQELLSAEELAQSDAFYGSGAGQKYAKQGLIQIYTGTGHAAPEEMPTLTDRELKELEIFAESAGGAKLIEGRALESLEARMATGAKIQELVASCRQRSDS